MESFKEASEATSIISTRVSYKRKSGILKCRKNRGSQLAKLALFGINQLIKQLESFDENVEKQKNPEPKDKFTATTLKWRQIRATVLSSKHNLEPCECYARASFASHNLPHAREKLRQENTCNTRPVIRF